MKRRITLTLTAVMAATLLFGCGSKDDTSGTDANKGADAAQTESGDAAAEDTAAAGGILKMSAGMEPGGLLPTDLISTDSNMIAQFVMEPLGRYNDAGEMEPYLAEEFIENPDEGTFTIKLRDGITYSDGSPLNAEDVKWNLENFQEVKASLGNIASVEATDDKTVVVHYDTWFNDALNSIGRLFMVSSKAVEEQGADAIGKKPVGTGAFTMESWEPGVKITFNRNDQYWQEPSKLDGVEVLFIPDAQSRISAFMAGEIDVVDASTVNNAKQLEGAGYERISKDPVIGGMIHGIAFNTVDEGPLQDVRVRQAIVHALDRDAYVQSYSSGMYQTVDQYCPKDFWAYNEKMEGIQYDTEKTKELLADAGYPDGLTITLTYATNDEERATVLQGMLADAGITLEMNGLEWSAFDQCVIGGGGWEGIALWTNGADVSVTTYANQFGENAFFFSSSIAKEQEILDKIAEASSAKTREELKPLMDELQELVIDKYCLVGSTSMPSPLYYAQDTVKELNYGVQAMTQLTPEKVYLTK